MNEKASLEFLGRVLNFVEETRRKNFDTPTSRRPVRGIVAASLIWNYDGALMVRSAVEMGVHQQAMQLLRPMLENIATVRWILAADSDRRALRFIASEKLEQNQMIRKAQEPRYSQTTIGSSILARTDDIAENEAFCTQIENEFNGIRRTSWNGRLSAEDMFWQAEMGARYLEYKDLCKPTHSAAIAIGRYITFNGETMVAARPAPPTNFFPALIAGMYLLQMLKVFSDEYGGGLDPEIDALVAAVE